MVTATAQHKSAKTTPRKAPRRTPALERVIPLIPGDEPGFFIATHPPAIAQHLLDN